MGGGDGEDGDHDGDHGGTMIMTMVTGGTIRMKRRKKRSSFNLTPSQACRSTPRDVTGFRCSKEHTAEMRERVGRLTPTLH